VINDKWGEVGSIKSSHDVHLLCLTETGGTGFPNPVAPGSGSSALSASVSIWQTRCHRVSKTGGTGFGCWVQQAHVIKSL
jgi:hypothetical protein